MTAWMHLLVSLVGGGILLGLGLTKARARAPIAGWLCAAAGLIIPLSACCVSSVFFVEASASDSVALNYDWGTIFQVTSILGSMGDLVAMVLVAAAFVVLSRAPASPGA